MILYLYKYDLILPCPVTDVVKFGVTLIFSFNLSAILGKYNFFNCTFCRTAPFLLPLFFYTAFS